MALANFFERAATAASQVLAGFGTAAFKERLEAQVVGVTFDGSVARSVEGAALLDLTVRLLARLYPSIAIHAVDDAAAGRAAELSGLARGINPDVTLESAIRLATVAICVGRHTPEIAGIKLFAGSNGSYAGKWVTTMD